MEKSGRRPLLLGGMAVMIFSNIIITLALNLQQSVPWMAYISIICVISFVIGFSIGLGKSYKNLLHNVYKNSFAFTIF